jgi:hypothetical protein
MIEGGHERLSLTLQTLDVGSHSKLARDEDTKDRVEDILTRAVIELVTLCRETKDHQ